MSLYEKGKNLAWNATDVDWTIDVDVEKLAHEAQVDLFHEHVHEAAPRADA